MHPLLRALGLTSPQGVAAWAAACGSYVFLFAKPVRLPASLTCGLARQPTHARHAAAEGALRRGLMNIQGRQRRRGPEEQRVAHSGGAEHAPPAAQRAAGACTSTSPVGRAGAVAPRGVQR